MPHRPLPPPNETVRLGGSFSFQGLFEFIFQPRAIHEWGVRVLIGSPTHGVRSAAWIREYGRKQDVLRRYAKNAIECGHVCSYPNGGRFVAMLITRVRPNGKPCPVHLVTVHIEDGNPQILDTAKQAMGLPLLRSAGY